MRSQLKEKRGKISPPLGFEPWSPGTKSQCATNDLRWHPEFEWNAFLSSLHLNAHPQLWDFLNFGFSPFASFYFKQFLDIPIHETLNVVPGQWLGDATLWMPVAVPISRACIPPRKSYELGAIPQSHHTRIILSWCFQR